MINRYLEFVNDSNNVYKIKADAGIKIRSAWHTYYNILEVSGFKDYYYDTLHARNMVCYKTNFVS